MLWGRRGGILDSVIGIHSSLLIVLRKLLIFGVNEKLAMARDSIHNLVVETFKRENWHVTHDPLTFRLGKNRVMVDLGIERVIGIEKDHAKIAVEIKSFSAISTIHAYYEALGQYIFYSDLLKFRDSDRKLYLAIPEDAYEKLLENELIQMSLDWRSVRLIIIDLNKRKIVQWIN
ncbi:MAG: element excision factor XisH family protein [Bacteroidota bacterium]